MGEPRFDRRLAAQARERAGLQLSPDDQALLAQQLPPADAQQFAAQEVQAPGLVEELQALLAPQQPTPQQAFLQQAGPQTADATSAAPAESAAERSERLRRAAMGPPIAPEDRGVAGRTVTPQTDALRQAEREGTPTFVPPLTNAPSATGLGPQTLLGIRTGDEESAAPGEPRRARAEAGGTTSEARRAPGPSRL